MAALMPWIPPLHRVRLALAADFAAIAATAALPWSTSAENILVWLWLLLALSSFDRDELCRVLRSAAGGLPVLLVALGAVGMLWAFDVPFKERLGGFGQFYKLLFIPALIVHFRHSARAAWVMNVFIASCLVMLALSWLAILFPGLPLPVAEHGGGGGVLVKDYIVQSAEFAVCAFLLAAVAVRVWRNGQRAIVALLVALILALLGNIFAVTTSRTAVVVLPVLVLLFACTFLSWRGTLALMAVAVAFAAVVWSATPDLRGSVIGLLHEVGTFQPEGTRSRAGERLEFWKKSVGFVADAPLIGHGTGSVRDQFRKTVTGETGMAALAAANPHNQTLAVAIQLGLLGTVVLFAMWFAHLLLFVPASGFAAWAGLVIVAQNLVGSLFNSHLFDFTQGWGYVIGVGVAAGALLRGQAKPGG